MKKHHFYLVSVVILIAAAGVVVQRNNNDRVAAAFFPLKERRGVSAKSVEATQVQMQFDKLVKIVRTNPEDIKARIDLASLYIQEARVTGDHSYYDMAAMNYVNEVLEKDSLHFDALILRALVSLSQHQFARALTLAEKASSINPDNAFVHGVLVDANVELGNYEEAVRQADIMISLRPDLRSYSRVSYLRELHGDFPGAIEAMNLAVDAGPPGDEATEWSRVQLGKLYEVIGDLENAAMHYHIALQRRPGYAYALAGQGRIALATKEYDKAIAFFTEADSMVKDHSFKEEMADVYEQAGDKAKADSLINRLLDEMNRHNHLGSGGEHEYDENLELASMYQKAGNYDEALEHAIIEFNRRPKNIHVNETMAWIYYNLKEFDKAVPHLESAMKTRYENPELLCRAGLIYAKTGNKEKARQLLVEATKLNSGISTSLKSEALKALQSLNSENQNASAERI